MFGVGGGGGIAAAAAAVGGEGLFVAIGPRGMGAFVVRMVVVMAVAAAPLGGDLMMRGVIIAGTDIECIGKGGEEAELERIGCKDSHRRR